MATFGKTTVGIAGADNTATRMHGCKYTCPEPASITSITARCAQISGGARDMACYIYSDVAGVPTVLLATTNTVLVADGVFGWVTFPFAIPYVVPAGDYWLMIWGNVGQNLTSYDAGAANQWAYDNTGYAWNVPPNPFTVTAYQAHATDIYATYDPAGSLKRLLVGVGL